MSNIDYYTKFIAEQIRKGSVAGLRTGELTETADAEAQDDDSQESINKNGARIKKG